MRESIIHHCCIANRIIFSWSSENDFLKYHHLRNAAPIFKRQLFYFLQSWHWNEHAIHSMSHYTLQLVNKWLSFIISIVNNCIAHWFSKNITIFRWKFISSTAMPIRSFIPFMMCVYVLFFKKRVSSIKHTPQYRLPNNISLTLFKWTYFDE